MIKDLLKQRILILDGAMGTLIQSYDLTENDYRGRAFDTHSTDLKGNHDILSLTRPDIIRNIHQRYIAAGADIITTNTFNANAISQAEFMCEEFVYELNLSGVQLAKESALKSGRKLFVAGSIGTTSQPLSFNNSQIDFDAFSTAFQPQVRGLIDGGVDLFLVETVFDGLNAKTILSVIADIQKEKKIETPIIISVTIDNQTGNTFVGQSLFDIYSAISDYSILGFGVNCSFGSADLYPLMEQLSEKLPCYLCIYPNAGLPNKEGIYSDSPEQMANRFKPVAEKKLVNIVGGCCGTTPEHIRCIKKMVENIYTQ